MIRERSVLLKSLIIFFVSIVVLTLGFYRNEWRATGKKWFYEWKENQEFMVLGRLVETRQNGVLSESGFIGIGDGDSWMDVSADLVRHQRDVYLNNGAFEKYAPYETEPAAYGVVFGLIDEFTDFNPGLNLKIFRAITSVLTAAALALFITWVGMEFNLLAAIFTLIGTMLSEWLALFGGSIYWNIWAYYLPFLCVLFYFAKTSYSGKYAWRKAFLVVYFSVFVAGLFRGHMYITTELVMLTIPVFYYAFRDRWAVTSFIQRMALVSASAVAASLSVLLVLFVQIYQVTGNVSAAWAHILDTLLKRSVGNPDQFSGVLAESLSASVSDVLKSYLTGRAFDFNSIFHIGLEISYLSVFIFFGLCSLLFFIQNAAIPKSGQSQKGLALVLSTWCSVLAPLSWLVLFKAHSFIHTHQNFILWQMPFTLFGFALCGFVLGNLLRRTPVSH